MLLAAGEDETDLLIFFFKFPLHELGCLPGLSLGPNVFPAACPASNLVEILALLFIFLQLNQNFFVLDPHLVLQASEVVVWWEHFLRDMSVGWQLGININIMLQYGYWAHLKMTPKSSWVLDKSSRSQLCGQQ